MEMRAFEDSRFLRKWSYHMHQW